MNVPALRFKEFRGDWEAKKLRDISAQISYGLTVRPEYINDGIPLISAREIKDGVIDYEKAPKISQESYDKLSDKAMARKGDIFLSKTGTIGLIAYVSSNIPLAITQNIAVIRIEDESYFHSFILHSLRTRNFYKSAIDKVNQSTIMDLQLQDIRKLKISIPSLPEQTKIANFLTAVDNKITLLTKKADLLSQYKKGVMQQIFSQELRFKDDDGQEFPEWEEKMLGDIAVITTGTSNRIDSSIADGAYTFFDRSQDIRTSDIYLFDCEAVIVAGEGQEFVPKHFIGKFDLHQRTYAIIKFRFTSGKYLFYYIHNFRHYFLSQAVGSTVKSLRLPMFQQMPISTPSLPEQTKIANFLTAIDEKITNNQTQLDAVKQYKQGLLQQMFV